MDIEPQPRIPNDQPLSVTLQAQQWNAVIALLNEVAAPARITLPLIQAIQRQCMQAAGDER